MIGARLRCAGCQARLPWRHPDPWRCPQAGLSRPPSQDHDHDHDRDRDIDHLLQPQIDAPLSQDLDDACDEPLPFVRFRRRLYAYHRARAAGFSDEDFVALLRRLDAQIAAVESRGFRSTPLAEAQALAQMLGLPSGSRLWCKDETGNVSGSHKGRHLFGLLIEILVDEALRMGTALGTPPESPRPLAIASCGNAALAAAVLARAVGRRLQVFIPPDAEPSVQARLQALSAEVTICARPAPSRLATASQHAAGVDALDGGEPAAGDPTYHAFQAAVAAGALPFCCQGPDNGLAIEGGQTLIYELIAALGPRRTRLRHLFVQVGGGALFSAVATACAEAVQAGLLPTLPRLYAVQTQAVAPLARAYQRLLAQLAGERPDSLTASTFPGLAATYGQPAQRDRVAQALHWARQHRRQFMSPWSVVGAPHSLARGILDDETYDWAATLQGLLNSGGYPVLVSEAALAQAQAAARAAGFARVDATGASGLAGLLTLTPDQAFSSTLRDGDDVAVLLTGAER